MWRFQSEAMECQATPSPFVSVSLPAQFRCSCMLLRMFVERCWSSHCAQLGCGRVPIRSSGLLRIGRSSCCKPKVKAREAIGMRETQVSRFIACAFACKFSVLDVCRTRNLEASDTFLTFLDTWRNGLLHDLRFGGASLFLGPAVV